MNSDPGLAVGKSNNHAVSSRIHSINRVVHDVLKRILTQTHAIPSRLHSFQRCWLRRDFPCEYRNGRRLCRVHLWLPGLFLLLRSDVETGWADLLASQSVPSCGRTRDTTEGKTKSYMHILYMTYLVVVKVTFIYKFMQTYHNLVNSLTYTRLALCREYS